MTIQAHTHAWCWEYAKHAAALIDIDNPHTETIWKQWDNTAPKTSPIFVQYCLCAPLMHTSKFKWINCQKCAWFTFTALCSVRPGMSGWIIIWTIRLSELLKWVSQQQNVMWWASSYHSSKTLKKRGNSFQTAIIKWHSWLDSPWTIWNLNYIN